MKKFVYVHRVNKKCLKRGKQSLLKKSAKNIFRFFLFSLIGGMHSREKHLVRQEHLFLNK